MQHELQMIQKFRAANGDDSWLHTFSPRVPLSEHPLHLCSRDFDMRRSLRRPPVTVGRVQSIRRTKEVGACLWVHLSLALSLGRQCTELGYSCSWPSEETPRLSKGKKVIERSIENFVPVVAVTKQKAALPLNSRRPQETLGEKKKWRIHVGSVEVFVLKVAASCLLSANRSGFFPSAKAHGQLLYRCFVCAHGRAVSVAIQGVRRLPSTQELQATSGSRGLSCAMSGKK